MSIQNDDQNPKCESSPVAGQTMEKENVEHSADTTENDQNQIENPQEESLLTKEERLAKEIDELVRFEQLIFGQLGSALLAVHKENLRTEQNLYEYRIHLRRSTIICILSVLSNVILLSAFLQYPKYRTVQTSDNSVICELNPENNPATSHQAIENFAKEALLAAYSFDYVNYVEQNKFATDRYFTDQGKEAFNQALINSGAVDHIIANKLSMKASTQASPQLEKYGRDKYGKMYWIVRAPVQIDFYAGSATPKNSEKYFGQIRIVETTRTAFNPRGVGVKTMTLHPVQ